MKRILLIASMALICSCSKSNEDKAKELIESKLKLTMNDWSSYESVEYGKLDSTIYSYNDIYGVVYDAKFESLKSDHKYFLEMWEDGNKAYEDSSELCIKKMKLLLREQEDSMKSFKPKFDGWKLRHTYRGKNAVGAVIINTTIFYFDKDISKVTKMKEENE